MITLELILTLMGWAMAGVPIVIFLSISLFMILGAAKDDEHVKMLVALGTGSIAIGFLILFFVYFTNVLVQVK